jgi:galactokinase
LAEALGSAECPDRFIAFSPGRVNLIGEHTDYNDGLCLPFAIKRGVTVTAEPLDEPRIDASALDLGESDSFRLGSEAEAFSGWRAFVRGIAAELAAGGHSLRGACLTIEGDLPRGAGLSSSAALAVSLALALLAVAGEDQPDRRELARLCSRVENEWVGARTGLLDQLAVLLGREGHAVRLDCRTLETRAVPLDLGDWKLATLDSGAEHAHGESGFEQAPGSAGCARSGYNRRRAECERARLQLGLDSLRDATLADAAELADPLGRRVRHVITENERVDATVAALARGELEAVASLLDASHRSLRDDFDVSAPEVEQAIERCRDAGAAGARIVGGGFGGSVLGLFPPSAEPPSGAVAVAPGPAASLL